MKESVWLAAWREVRVALNSLAEERRVGRDLLLILGSGLLSALLSLAVPAATGWLFGTIIPEGKLNWAPWLFVCLAAVTLALAAGEYLRGRLFLILVAGLDRALHARVFTCLLYAKPAYLRTASRGDWAGRLLGLADARRAVAPPVLAAVFGLFAGVANLVFMAALQPLLAAGALLLTFVLVTATVYMTRAQILADLKVSRCEGRLAGFVATVATDLPVLRRANALQRAGRRQRQLFAELQTAHAESQRAIDTLMTIYAGFALAAPLALFAVAGLVIARPEAAEFLAFYAAFGQMLFAFLGAVTALSTLARAVAPVRRILPILQTPQETGGADPGPRFLGLRLNKVAFRYEPDAPPALEDIDFALKPAEILALTGASGSGKTTLLKLLLGLEEPQQGQIYFNEQPLASWNPQALRRLAGVALQTSPVFPGTIAANIAGFGEYKGGGEAVAAVAGLAGLSEGHAALPDGLASVITDPWTLSETLRQRIVLARALLGRPGLLLIDEAASALPPDALGPLLAHIRRTWAACLLITHNPEVMAGADRVITLEAGRVIASDQ